MAYKRRENERLEEQLATGAKRFVKYAEGAKIMSMGEHSFRDLAKDAKAIYRINDDSLIHFSRPLLCHSL